MKKNEQIEVNAYVENTVNVIDAVLHNSSVPWRRLYGCSADWGQVGVWVLLRSYSTVVAAYNAEKDEFFDFLRLVYDYTATSAQHITKFRNYCRSVTGHDSTMYKWRAV